VEFEGDTSIPVTTTPRSITTGLSLMIRLLLGLLGAALWFLQRGIALSARGGPPDSPELVVALAAYLVGVALLFGSVFWPRLRVRRESVSGSVSIPVRSVVHTRLIAAMFLVYGIMYMTGATVLAWFQRGDDRVAAGAFISIFGSAGVMVYLALGIVLIVCGAGLLVHREWARRGAIAAGFALAQQFPVGITLAFYTWWGLVGRTRGSDFSVENEPESIPV